MRITWDAPLEMDDGVVIRADVFGPDDDGSYPVILSYGPYAKWHHFADGSPHQWERMSSEHPDTVQGSTNTYQNWELVDPEKWVPDGYVVVRVDSRGAGRSPGFLDLWSPRETQDLYQCIEWAGTQEWSNGKVGLNGISYYAMNQWQVAELQPPHLAAMCAWEGASDLYRELAYHGGILCSFTDLWYQGRVLDKQHGLGVRGPLSRYTGEPVAGPETEIDEVLAATATDLGEDFQSHPQFDAYWADRVPDLSKIEVPLLSAGNWGGVGLHLRGNIEGFTRAGSTDKWLEVHGLEHWTHFYTEYGVDLQKRFFGHFLKGENTGWDDQPPVSLNIRHPGDRFVLRDENEWPLARTAWTTLYLGADVSLGQEAGEETGALSYDAFGDGLTFITPPLETETEITGPVAAKVFISSETEDADVFLVLRVFTEDLEEITFKGANEPHTAVSHGWLRASRRKLDPTLSETYRPFHTHDEDQPLTPGETYELDVEIWPTSIVIPAGYRVGLSVRSRDYVYPGSSPQPPARPSTAATSGVAFTGVGPFRHNISANRDPAVFGGKVTIHVGPETPSHLLLPIIPDPPTGSTTNFTE
ncbi:MAG: CocE/NonD family hydrolase [Acidimicrobiia bacterium]|nr:CocE/NonD family hydrolase [Acidimicrobiia bacterium]